MTKYEELKIKLSSLSFQYRSASAFQHNCLAGKYWMVNRDNGVVESKGRGEPFAGAIINRKGTAYGSVELDQMNDAELLKIQSAIDDYLNRTKREVDEAAAKLAAVEELLS